MKRKTPNNNQKSTKKKSQIGAVPKVEKYSEQWYENSSAIREESLDIITHIDRYSDEKVSETLFDFYYVSQSGDEKYIFPLLNCGRANIVYQAIHTLGRMKMYEPMFSFLMEIINSQDNDYCYDALKSEAIFQVSRYAKENMQAAEKIKSLFSEDVFDLLSLGYQLDVLEAVCFLTDVELSSSEERAFTYRQYNPNSAEYERLRETLSLKLDNHIKSLR